MIINNHIKFYKIDVYIHDKNIIINCQSTFININIFIMNIKRFEEV